MQILVMLTGPIIYQLIPTITEMETIYYDQPESYMTPSGETLLGARWLKPLLMMKATTRTGTWNVCTMYKTSKAAEVGNKMTSQCPESAKADE